MDQATAATEDRTRPDTASPVPNWDRLAVPYLFDRAGVDPAAVGIVFEGRTRTYGELRERSRAVGAGLLASGLEPQDRVAILSTNRLEYIEVEAGIGRARGVMVPLNWRLRPSELRNLLDRCGARVVFTETEFLPVLREIREQGGAASLEKIVLFDGDADDSLRYEDFCAQAPVDEVIWPTMRIDDPHEIIYTSGTTGQPKGVVWSNGSVLFNAMQQTIDYQVGPADSTYAMIDLYYIGGRHDWSWAVLLAGGTVHIKASSRFDAQEIVDYVLEHRITRVLWVPTMLYEIVKVPGLADRDTTSLRTIMCGGAPISTKAVETLRRDWPTTHFMQVFGLTEGGGTVTFVPEDRVLDKITSAGRASIFAEIRIDAGDRQPAAPGVDGEILVRGPGICAGYWEQPEETAAAIEDGWLKTGDIGQLDAENFLYVTGRKRDMIKSGGMNIFPAEIENVLAQHPDVLGAAVIGLPSERWGEQVCAVLEVVPGATLTTDEVIAYCREHLASFKKPSMVEIVDEIPRTSSGKAQKFKLRERFTASA